MDRHAVPQNIMEVEFKLFGSLTVKQFAYLAACFIGDLMLYFSPLQDFFKYPAMVIVGLSGVFLALGQINGQPSTTWVSNFIIALFSSQERVWRKGSVTPEALKDNAAPKLQHNIDDLLPTRKVNPMLNLRDSPLIAVPEGEELEYEQDVDHRLDDIDKHFDFLYKDLPKNFNTEIPVPKIKPTIPRSITTNPTKPIKSENVITDPAKLNLAGTVQYKSSAYKNFNVNDYTQEQIIAKAKQSLLDEVLADEPVEEQPKQQFTAQTIMREPLGHKTNLIKGLVVDKNQQPQISANINIKDIHENLIRKALTDKAGIFALTTPLTDGEYFIDIEAKGCKFPRFKVLLNGNELPVYKFSAQ
jgi:hypothetical protein